MAVWSRGRDWLTVINCRIDSVDWLTGYVVELWKDCTWLSRGDWVVVDRWKPAVVRVGKKEPISPPAMLADTAGIATQLGRRGEREGVVKDERGKEEIVMEWGIAE